MIIRTESLTKYYGKVRGVVDINLEVREGEIFGFLGPNGAGKTTTQRILLDLIRPTRGQAFIFGRDAHRDSSEIKRRIGYLPAEFGMYDDMRADEYLDHIGAVRGSRSCPLREKLVESLHFDPSRHIKTYSHGNKQKLAIVQAFMHDPELLILDEPTTGLDPLMQQEFYNLILEEKRRGKTIFLSSHILHEVERVCDRAAILKEGRLIAVHEISEIRRFRLKTIEIDFREDVLEETFRIEGVRKIEKHGKTIRLWLGSGINEILRLIASHPVENLVVQDAGLEDIFMEYYSDTPMRGGG
ncbi:MAG: ABC transporter ATP-binding protein [bacterium]